MKALHLTILVLCSLTAPLVAQRPKTVAEAVTRFERVREDAERNRHQPVRDLGLFAENAATTILLAELKRAKAIGYRSTVVKALGYKKREGAVPALLSVMTSTPNARLAESAANALRSQGDDGVAALVAELPASAGNKKLRDAICYSLGRVETGEASRDALLREIARTTRTDRQAALRGLKARRHDARVDEVRMQLVGDKDAYLAAQALEQLATSAHKESARLAITLARRIPATGARNAHTAVMAGLLTGPQPSHYEALLFAAARADKPFGEERAPRWRECFGNEALAKWLRDKGTKAKGDEMQAAAATALAFVPEEQHAVALAALISFLQKRSPQVVQAAATSLVTLDLGEPAAKALQELIKKGNATGSAIAVTALHVRRRDDSAWHTQLLTLSKHKRPSIRAAAVRALITAPADAEQLLDAAKNNLSHRAWQVRTAAIDLLVALRSAKSPPLLFTMLDKEKARMHEDVRTALRDLTGLQFVTLREWQQWWAKEGDMFQPRQRNAGLPGRNGDTLTVSYWNIPVHSDRVAFVVDTSGSMLKPFGTGNATRLWEAKRQLRKVFDALPAKAKMNVITFAGDTTSLFPKLQALGKKQRTTAEAFVKALYGKGPTNVHDALAAAFADDDVDTIFLLTDGQPSAGPIVDRDALSEQVARWNADRGIRIHTVAIGQKSALLARLAKDSGGEHSVSR